MELRLALRAILARPTLSIAVILAIALGIAITTALFSVVDALLLRPLPFSEPHQLVAIDERPDDGRREDLGWREVADGRRHVLQRLDRSPLVQLVSQAGHATFFEPGPAAAAGIAAHGVDARFFELFRVRPVLGTSFSRVHEEAGVQRGSPTPLPIMISYELWQQRYGGDPRIIGGAQMLLENHVRILGVTPPGFRFPGETNVWAPVDSTRGRPPAYARLEPTASVHQLAGAFPELIVLPLREAVRPGGEGALLLLFGAATLLLLVAWIQVAGLTLSGAVTRLSEFGSRLALGATRARLFRQTLVENGLLAGAALALASLALPPLHTLLVARLPPAVVHGQDVAMDYRVFVFAGALSFAGLVLLSAFSSAVLRRATPLALLTGRLSDAPIGAGRIRRLLLMAQVAATTVVLYLGGLTATSYARVVRLDYGFDAARVLVFTPPSWARGGSSPEEFKAAFARANSQKAAALDILRDMDGVLAATTFFGGPLGVGASKMHEQDPITHLEAMPVRGLSARRNAVGADFIQAFGATLLSGAGFDDPGHVGRADVALINETLARQLHAAWPPGAEIPVRALVGREVRIDRWRVRVIGIVKDLVDSAPGVPPDPQVFVRDTGTFSPFIAIRVAGAPERVVPALAGALAPVWGEVEPARFRLLRDEVERVVAPYRAQAILLGLIAASCLPIALVGLAGALTYGVQVRRREDAIRAALGADPATLHRVIVRQALGVVGAGLLGGIVLAMWAGTVARSRLFQVGSIDGLTTAGVAALVLLAGWLCALAPARRASRASPADALRQL